MSELIEIPIETRDPSFRIRTVLDDVEMFMQMQWNSRVERWHLDILDSNENPLLMGIPMNIDTELIDRFEIPGLPPGKLVLFDTSLKGAECGSEELGERCKLIYETAV